MCRLDVEEIGVVERDIFGVEPWDHRCVYGIDWSGHCGLVLVSLRVVAYIRDVRGA